MHDVQGTGTWVKFLFLLYTKSVFFPFILERQHAKIHSFMYWHVTAYYTHLYFHYNSVNDYSINSFCVFHNYDPLSHRTDY